MIINSTEPELIPYWQNRLSVTAWLHRDGIWSSRRLRKGHGPLWGRHYQRLNLHQIIRSLFSVKRIKRLEVSTAIAFIVGPFLFALGSFVSLVSTNNLNASSALLAIGSIFFTAGGFWQLQQARIATKKLPKNTKSWKWCGFRCAATQSAGTILFNVNTFFLWAYPHSSEYSWLILAIFPNFVGSVLFLISAMEGLLEVGHGKLLVYEPMHLGWWIAIVNGLGCLWFMQSAVAALPVSFHSLSVINIEMSIRTTLMGSIAFLVVGILSLAECSEDEHTAT